MRWLLGLAIVLSACFVLARSANASCLMPDVQRLWSYPAPGASDVPVNAEVWVLTTGWSAPRRATLDGREVDVSQVSFGGIHIAPGRLEAAHAYTLRLEYAPVGNADPTVLEIAFATVSSDLLATPSDAPVVLQISARPGLPWEQVCGAEIQAQDCFDTGQDTLVHFELAAADAEAWLVDAGGVQALWPSACAGPMLFTHRPVEATCYDVRTIGNGGLASEPTHRCYEAASDPYATPSAAPGDDDAGTPEAPPGARAGDVDAGSGAADSGSLDTPGTAMQRGGDRARNSAGCQVTGVVDGGSAWTWLLAAALWLRRRSPRRSRS
jgi:uncharacterized protein (TIGR03382 family)